MPPMQVGFLLEYKVTVCLVFGAYTSCSCSQKLLNHSVLSSLQPNVIVSNRT